MTRQYYSSRTKTKSITLKELYQRLQHLYLLFCDKDFFKENGGITSNSIPDAIKYEAALDLGFQLFPITHWPSEDITEDHIFDTIEFLYDHAAKPGVLEWTTDETGWSYQDYESYDDESGKREFRNKANAFLVEYKIGYELTKGGIILAKGTDGLQHILEAEIIPYDEANVDSKVRNAITKWRNRHLSLSEKKEAIRELADVFEWLKKTKELGKVLDGKDESALFDLANNFGIRHHNPNQKTNYDHAIWYSWIFHFYLATYHAAIRLLIKKEEKESRPTPAPLDAPPAAPHR